MTEESLPPTVTIATVEQAEAAWLEATIADGHDAMRRLVHPDCVVVHAPVGHIHDVDAFLEHAGRMGSITETETIQAEVRHFDGVAIVSCLQEIHVAYVADLAPFVIQAAVTRVWVRDDTGGWQLAHMQLARRLPPG